MKNQNMVRTKEQHRVGRSIRCCDETECRIMELMLRGYCIGSMRVVDKNNIGITLQKEEFEKIRKDLKLNNEIRYGKKTRYWKTEACGE